ncbi:hypothetical protein [Roseibacillus ishigakijimensis]|uniref:Uncharacterized protein n=2 Tax=Roseibacillus ishigakijimensis TaxID=454146 RepID=A0A934RR45_9BACT|nr:hypothetical protein [Roseibacillus ishigakijimensis]
MKMNLSTWFLLVTLFIGVLGLILAAGTATVVESVLLLAFLLITGVLAWAHQSQGHRA